MIPTKEQEEIFNKAKLLADTILDMHQDPEVLFTACQILQDQIQNYFKQFGAAISVVKVPVHESKANHDC